MLSALGTDTHLFVRKESPPLRSFDPVIINTLVEVMDAEGPTLHTHSIPKDVVKEADGSVTLHFENGESHNTDVLIWLSAVTRRLTKSTWRQRVSKPTIAVTSK